MQRKSTETGEWVHPLLRDDKVAELLTDEQQSRIVERYTEEAVRFITANKDRPFFLYLPHTAIHTPIYPGAKFRAKSSNGRLGDWIEELDWSTGRPSGQGGAHTDAHLRMECGYGCASFFPILHPFSGADQSSAPPWAKNRCRFLLTRHPRRGG